MYGSRKLMKAGACYVCTMRDRGVGELPAETSLRRVDRSEGPNHGKRGAILFNANNRETNRRLGFSGGGLQPLQFRPCRGVFCYHDTSGRLADVSDDGPGQPPHRWPYFKRERTRFIL